MQTPFIDLSSIEHIIIQFLLQLLIECLSFHTTGSCTRVLRCDMCTEAVLRFSEFESYVRLLRLIRPFTRIVSNSNTYLVVKWHSALLSYQILLQD